MIVEHLDWHWLFWIPLVATIARRGALHVALHARVAGARARARSTGCAAALMSVGISLVLIAISETTMWGWGSAKTLALLAARCVVCGAWVAVEVRSQRAAGRHDDDADPRRVDDEPGGVPARRRDVLLVHRVPAVRAAAEEHRLRLRRLGRRLGPLPAALDGRHGVLGMSPGAIAARFGSKRALIAGTAFTAAAFGCSPSRTRIPTTC